MRNRWGLVLLAALAAAACAKKAEEPPAPQLNLAMPAVKMSSAVVPDVAPGPALPPAVMDYSFPPAWGRCVNDGQCLKVSMPCRCDALNREFQQGYKSLIEWRLGESPSAAPACTGAVDASCQKKPVCKQGSCSLSD